VNIIDLTSYLALFFSYCTVYVKLLPLIKGCLLLMHSFWVISLNIAINRILPKMRFIGLHFCCRQSFCLQQKCTLSLAPFRGMITPFAQCDYDYLQ